MTGRGERLNLTSDPEASPAEAAGPPPTASQGAASRPYVAIHFACCGVYTKIYQNKNGTAYHGACPKCCRPATIRISDDGTDDRYFVVS
jgi:hypothetical protein